MNPPYINTHGNVFDSFQDAYVELGHMVEQIRKGEK
jgi:hypothetical protein